MPYVIACALTAIYLVIILPPVAAVLIDMDLGIQLAMATQISLGRHPFVDYSTGVYLPVAGGNVMPAI
ncbi:MAG: hypothetical protein CMJ49_07575 [Planctomycetaceae bacterium]|nr:hypothetical protein [Planctomycetaceae bacterium]